MAFWTSGARLLQPAFPHCETAWSVESVERDVGGLGYLYVVAGEGEGSEDGHEEEDDDVLHGCGWRELFDARSLDEKQVSFGMRS
jgi:hypothetical protein